MKLQPGERLTSTVVEAGDNDSVAQVKRRNASVYVVRETLVETPWYGIYRAKKIFRNARGDGLDLEEADEAEWLDVLLKTINYTRIDSREYVKARREQVWFEAKKVLGCGDTNLLPEPLDYLEVNNAHDSFTFARSGSINHKEPVLVFENIAGQPLAKWRVAEQPTLGRVLRVVAEILEFLSVLHQQECIATAIGPAAMWIDPTDRVYHLASDCIVSVKGARTISADRFPQGFAPPEAFEASGTLSAAGDLYSWATLAYFLITGISPAQIAASQQERHATLNAAERVSLTNALNGAETSDVAALAERLGVKGDRFARRFPESFVGALAACWNPIATSRPASIVELRNCLANAPPPKVDEALAVLDNRGQVQILLSGSGLDVRLEIVIRRFAGPTGGPHDGVQVYVGPIKSCITDAGANGHQTYGIFVRDSDDGHISHSQVTSPTTIDLRSTAELLGVCETLARGSGASASLFEEPALPRIIKLLVLHPALSDLGRRLFDSREAVVRRWAVALLQKAQKQGNIVEAQDASTVLWDRGLRDAHFDVRLAAANVLLNGSGDPGLSILDRMARLLGGVNIDDRIRALRALKRCGVWDSSIQAATQALEADRIIACKACSVPLRAIEMEAHLRSTHNYVDFDAQLIPRERALEQLWPRLLTQGDAAAATELAKLLVGPDQSVETLQLELINNCRTLWLPLQQRLPPAERSVSRERLMRSLRANSLVLRATWFIVNAHEPELRELAREALLPAVAGRLTDDFESVATYRQFVDALTRRDDLDCKIRTCDALARVGASQLVARRASYEYGLDRETVCPDCRTAVRRRDLAKHERVVHGRYVFDSRGWQWERLVQHLGVQLLSGNPTLEIARLCDEILEERIGNTQWGACFAAALSNAAASLPIDRARLEFIDLAASVLSPLSRANHLVSELLTISDSDMQELAFAMLATGALPIMESVVEAALPALQHGGLDERFRHGAVRMLLPALAQPLAERLLHAFVKPLPDKLVGIERLRQIQSEVGNMPAIAAVCSQLEATMRIQCPLCQAVLNGSEMRSHAQQAHRMVWEGRRLRQPWSVAEDCLELFEQDGKVEWLEVGESYALLGGGEPQRLAFIREALKRGLAKDRYLPYFSAAASNAQSTLCGDCFQWIPSPRAMPIMPVKVEGDRLTSDFVNIAANQTLLQSEPEISVRDGVWTAPQPEGHFSRQGVFVLHGVLFAMLLLGVIVLGAFNPQFWLVLLASWVGGAALSGVAAAVYRPRHSSPLAIAWEKVVPELLKTELDQTKLAFIAGLVRVSESNADSGRQRHVEAAARIYQRSYEAESLTFAPLAQVLRLLILDQLRNQSSGGMAVQTITTYLHYWTLQKWSVDALDMMTNGGAAYLRLPAEQQRLLRWRWIRLCHAAGVAPDEIAALDLASDLFRAMLKSPERLDADAIATAFALLELPTERQQRMGMSSVFHWSADNSPHSFREPEVLARSGQFDLSVRAQGLYFQQVRLDSTSRIDVCIREQFVQTGWTHQRTDGGPDQRFKHNPPVGYQQVIGYEVRIDGHAFPSRSDPTLIVAHIRLWVEVYFKEILLRLKMHARTGGSPRRLNGTKVRCPDCGKMQSFVEGKVGLSC